MTQTPRLRIFTHIDFGLLLTLIVCLLSAWPLLQQAGLPNGSDVLYHTYRVGEMDRSWTHGVLFPRWAEGMYYGYGSPLFHYYASLTYYLTSIFMRLFGLDALGALRLLIVVCMMLAGSGMYGFVRDRISRLGGVIAALVYVYSPYIFYTEPYARGAYPELLALCLFPLILWAFHRLLTYRRARDVVLAALSLFLLIIAHNLMALTLTGVLILWLLWHVVTRFRQGRATWWPYALGLVAIGFGIGLAAYFWLPVLLESDAVSLENLTGVALLDYRNFFVPLEDLLAHSPLADAGAINGLRLRLNLGLAQWLLALAGGVGLIGRCWRGRKNTQIPAQWRDGLFFGGLALIFLFLITPASGGIWETVNIARYLQFPWRLLGPLMVCLAILAGMNALWIQRLPARGGAVIAAGIVAGIVGLALPLFYVPEWSNTTVDAAIAGYHAEEVSGRQLGTTFTNEYLPRTVTALANPTEWLLEDYANGYPVDPLNRGNIPEGAIVDLIDHNPQYDAWRVTTDEPFTMEVLTHDWAGWTAEIDGQPVDITPSLHHGFITFPVPAGEHTIQVYLGTTPARTLGNVISLIAFVATISTAYWLSRRESTQTALTVNNPLPVPYRLGLSVGVVVSVVLMIALLHEGISWLNSPVGEALPASNVVDYHLGDEFAVIGYDLNGRDFRPGDTVRLNVYWLPRAVSEYNYHSFVHISAGGPPPAQADKLHPAGRAIREWWIPGNGYIFDEYTILLPSTMPPGEYHLLVGLYSCEPLPEGECGNGYRPPVFTTEGESVGDAVPLGMITVRP